MVLPNSLLKFYPLVRALGNEIKELPDGARRLVVTVLYLWQQNAYPHLALRAPNGSNELLPNERVKRFATWLASQPFNDAAYWLASAYATWVGEEVRAAQALYFTPPRLADRVIDDLIVRGASIGHQHWHDPACGGAAFLVPVAQRMAQALTSEGLGPKAVLKKIEAQISGNDLDKTLLAISTQFLLMALSPYVTRSRYTPKFNLKNCDGLLVPDDDANAPDVIACNPPYRKLNAEETRKYASRFHDVIRNQPNIYGLFIRKTVDVVRTGGLVGLLTPTSFLSGASFSKLRSYMTECAEVLQLDMLSDRDSMFIAVEQETAITILQKSPNLAVTQSNPDVSVLSPTGDFVGIGKCFLSKTGEPWPVPRSASDAELIKKATHWRARLSDYGYTPKVGYLVAYRDERPRFSKRPKVKDQSCVVPILWAGDITVDGLVHGRATKQKRTDYFVQVASPDHSSVVTQPCVVLQRLTSSDQPHRLIASAVPAEWLKVNGGFVAENHVISLIANDDCAVSPEVLAALMNSPVINRLFKAISGATNVAVSELNELPLPDPHKLRKALVHNRNINTAVREAFGINA
jgi:adenine-specific DNA-methyltransferase